MPNNSINIGNVGNFLTGDATKAVGSVSLPARSASLNEQFSFTVLGASGTLGASATYELSSFRALSEMDPDNVLTKIKDKERPDRSGAWLKHQVIGKVNSSFQGSLAALGFNVDWGRVWTLSHYRFHDNPKERFLAAVLGDLPNFTTVFDDLAVLPTGDAVALEVRGEICASLKLSWSDAIASELGTLTNLLPPGKTAALKLDLGLTLRANISVTDDYMLVIARLDGGRFRVSVKKSKGNSMGMAAEIGVTGEIENLDLVADTVCGQLSGQLPPQAQGLLPLSKVKDSLKNMAKTKLEIGFGYEYSRIEQDKTLLQVILAPAALAQHQHELVKGNIAPILEEASQSHLPGLLESYLHEHSITRQRCYGFTLSLGKWIQLGGKKREVLTEVWRDQLPTQGQEPKRMLVFQGLGEYSGSGVGKWVVDFKAETPEYLPPPILAKDLIYGLHLMFQWPFRKELREDHLLEYLDSALLWRVLGVDGVADILPTLNQYRGKAGQVSIHLRFNDDQEDPHKQPFRMLVANLSKKGIRDFAGPLSQALPWKRDWSARRDPQTRSDLYAQQWNEFFANPCLEFGDIARSTEVALLRASKLPRYRSIRSELEYNATLEGKYPVQTPGTFTEAISMNCFEDEQRCLRLGTISNITSLLAGAEELTHAIQSKEEDYRVIESSYKKLAPFWLTSTLHARAMGAMFMAIAGDTSSFPISDVQRSLVLELGSSQDGPFTETLVIGSKT